VHVLTTVDEPRIKRLLADDAFFWIDLLEPTRDDIERLGRALGLHPVAIEDSVEFGQRPKVDPYGEHILLVFYTARLTGDPEAPAVPLEVHVYVSGDFIATIRHDGCQALDDLHESLAKEPTHEEEVLVYRVFDGLTDAFYPVIEAMEADIDALEAEVLTRPRREHLSRSYRLKQSVRDLQRVVASQHEQFRTAHSVILSLEGLTTSSKPYLRDVGDHLAQIAGEFERQTEDLVSLTQTYFNANADRLNAVATRLTIGGTIFIVWTVVTGFFGQNFGWLVDTIDTRTEFLVYGVGGLTVPTVILLTLYWVKRNDWF
jgi:magnesium transporter